MRATTATKRKSTGDIPDAKRTRRPTSAREDSDNSQQEHETSDGLFVEHEQALPKGRYVKKRSRASEPAMRRQRSDEYAPDEGRMESQAFLEFVKVAAEEKSRFKHNHYVDNFKSHLENEAEISKERIVSLGEEAKSSDEAFLKKFLGAFAASRPQPPPKMEDGVKKHSPGFVFASMYEKSRDMTKNAQEIIGIFEELNEKTITIDATKLINKDAWDEADEKMAEIIEIGYQAGIERHEKFLNDANDDEEIEKGDEVVGQFYPSDVDTTTTSWGKVARQAQKATKRLVKALPLRLEA